MTIRPRPPRYRAASSVPRSASSSPATATSAACASTSSAPPARNVADLSGLPVALASARPGLHRHPPALGADSAAIAAMLADGTLAAPSG